MRRGSRGHPVPLLRAPGERPGQPRYVHLYRRVREAVLSGALPPGTRLPSARTLARDEGISRNTVEAAFAQLRAEGFVTRHVGAGTWVSERIPDRPRASGPLPEGVVRGSRPGSAAGPASAAHAISERGRALVALGEDDPTPGLDFAPCVPGLDGLPMASWNRIAARHARRASGSVLMPAPPKGLPELRAAIAAVLALGRGVRCAAEQVVIVSSTQQAIALASRILLDPGDEVWFEEPGYVSARRALSAAGARLVPVPVRGEGIDVAAGAALAPRARLAYVTPSHQYPLGVTLSLARRLALLEWADAAGSWIFEDDYDSEVRHDGRPLASLQGIDAAARVIYAGTFNKILFPALRLAYLVLPPGLVEPFARARALADGFSPTLTQRVLAEFIDEGHFAAHVRAVRALYRERRDRFLEAASKHLPAQARPGPSEAGMHLVLHLPEGTDDGALSEDAHRRGLSLPALSSHFIGPGRSGLLVHYGAVPGDRMDRAVRALGDVVEVGMASQAATNGSSGTASLRETAT